MAADNPRVLELRRRVQADPASIAFAQLAEECRRSGDNDEAVGICRAGLAYHPDYLSARVTLGRALIELGRLDEAKTELDIVLGSAPDNLPANRALAEIYQQRGQMKEALELYKRALQLAKYDPDLEQVVERIENVVSPPPPPAPKVETPNTVVEDLFDFDTLIAQLGGRTQPSLALTPEPVAPPIVPAPSAIDAVTLSEDDGDPFSVLERQLRETEEYRPLDTAPALESSPEDDAEQRMLADLEDWLSAIVADRRHQPSA